MQHVQDPTPLTLLHDLLTDIIPTQQEYCHRYKEVK